jgi:SAM-dependent methyltransferase
MSRQFFPCPGILEVSNSNDLKTYLVEHGSHSPEENLRIYEKWFANAPRYLFRAVDRKFGLRQKILCDAGCAYGMNLVFCKPGSYGIEVQEAPAEFALSLGLRVYRRDVLGDELSDLPRAEAVWASAILEHVDSPHILLRKLHGLLVEGGLLTVYAPTIPILPVLRHLPWYGRFFRGHLAADHVNFFTPVTLRLTCERAGFETIEVSPFYPSALGIFNRVPGLRSLVDGCVYVGHKVPDWEYPQKATREVANNKHGFVRKQ